MKKLHVLIVMIVLTVSLPLMMSGCDQYDPQVLQQYSEQADLIELRINELAAMIEPAVQDLAAGNVISEKDTEKIKEAVSELNQLKPQLASIRAAIKNIEYSGDKWADTVNTGQAINNAIEYPYKSVVALILGIAGLLGKAFADNKKITSVNRKAEAAENSLGELVAGVEKIKKLRPEDKLAVTDAMDEAQGFETKKKVAAIKKELNAG